MTMDVYFVEPNEITAIAIRSILDRSSTLRYAGHAGDLESALYELPTVAPRVVLLKLADDIAHLLSCIQQVRDACPSASIVLKAAQLSPEAVKQALRLGVSGIATRGVTAKALHMCLESAGRGGCWIDRSLWTEIFPQTESVEVASSQLQEVPQVALTGLTLREQEVLKLIADGAANAEIAQRLGIGRETVKSHVRKLLTKLGARTRTEAAVHALRGTQSVG
jgi:DNA-binding NarL/FixJ family response regulator